MSYRELLPHPALRAFVDRFWVIAPDGAAPAQRPEPIRILPDGCIDVLFDIGSGGAQVVGTMTRATVPPTGACVPHRRRAVQARRGGTFLHLPADELTNRVLSAQEVGVPWLLLPSVCSGDLRLVLAELERARLERLTYAELDRAVRDATRRLLGEPAPGIEAVATELGMSRQHLAQRFRQHVGLTPKEFARVARLQRSLDHLQRAPAANLAGQALELGYFDQAHMCRDFQASPASLPSAPVKRAIPFFQSVHSGSRHETDMNIIANLIVEEIESCLSFWEGRLGFERSVEVRTASGSGSSS